MIVRFPHLSANVVRGVLTSKVGRWVRNKIRGNAKAIAGFLAPLLAAQVADRVGFDVPLPIVAQLLAALITSATVWLPANKPPVT